MRYPTQSVAIVMARIAIENRWQSHRWEAVGVVPSVGVAAEPQILLETPTVTQWLHPGFTLELFADETENYYLNISTPEPKLFVMWRMDERNGEPFAKPAIVTVSYGEAARLMDSNEQVDGLPLPLDLCVWLGEYVETNYRPEPKRKLRRRDPLHLAEEDRVKE